MGDNDSGALVGTNTSFYLPPGYQPRVINGAWMGAFGGAWGSDAWGCMGTDTCMGVHGMGTADGCIRGTSGDVSGHAPRGYDDE